MIITITQGDLLKEETEAIVNTVNCVGVMGKGIALQFKLKWPENYKAYEKACKAGIVKPGKIFVHELGKLAGKPYYIINFPTKDHWRGKSKLSYIQEGLDDLVVFIREHNVKSIAIPPLGCGNGGLEWAEVYPLIQRALSSLGNQVEVHLFEPKGAPDAKTMETRTEKPNLTPARALVIKLLSIYSEMEYSLGKIEIQKLCYFAQEAGENLRLNFAKNQYGPYASTLNHVLTALSGHYLIGVGDHDTAEAQISPKPEAIDEANELLRHYTDTLQRVERVATLIDGFKTPYGMELLATVHWVSKHDAPNSRLETITDGIYNWQPNNPSWNIRKQTLMKPEHIKIAIERLRGQNWL